MTSLFNRAIASALAAALIVADFAGPVRALPVAPAALSSAIGALDMRVDVAARRTQSARMNVNVSRERNVTREKTVNVNRDRDINIDRDRNVNINVDRNIFVRPVRPWTRRPYFGTVVAGVALGTIIAATTIPPAPAPNLCWYWTSSAYNQGYWDYCAPPQ